MAYDPNFTIQKSNSYAQLTFGDTVSVAVGTTAKCTVGATGTIAIGPSATLTFATATTINLGSNLSYTANSQFLIAQENNSMAMNTSTQRAGETYTIKAGAGSAYWALNGVTWKTRLAIVTATLVSIGAVFAGAIGGVSNPLYTQDGNGKLIYQHANQGSAITEMVLTPVLLFATQFLFTLYFIQRNDFNPTSTLTLGNSGFGISVQDTTSPTNQLAYSAARPPLSAGLFFANINKFKTLSNFFKNNITYTVIPQSQIQVIGGAAADIGKSKNELNQDATVPAVILKSLNSAQAPDYAIDAQYNYMVINNNNIKMKMYQGPNINLDNQQHVVTIQAADTEAGGVISMNENQTSITRQKGKTIIGMGSDAANGPNNIPGITLDNTQKPTIKLNVSNTDGITVGGNQNGIILQYKQASVSVTESSVSVLVKGKSALVIDELGTCTFCNGNMKILA